MVNIIQGSIKSFVVRITRASSGDPLNLSGVVEITTCMKDTSTLGELMLSLTGGQISVVDAVLGKIKITLDAIQTATLIQTDGDTLEVAVDLGDGPMKLQVLNAYAVIATVC